MHPLEVILKGVAVSKLLSANVTSELLLHVMSTGHVSSQVSLATKALATQRAGELEEAIVNVKLVQLKARVAAQHLAAIPALVILAKLTPPPAVIYRARSRQNTGHLALQVGERKLLGICKQ